MNEAEQVEYFNTTIKEAQVYISIARDSGLQREALADLAALAKNVAHWKVESIEVQNEDRANMLLGCECAIQYVQAEISMWLLLKEEKPEAAWDKLVDAQSAVLDASRAHHGFAHFVAHSDRLATIEQLIFPPQVFMSAGLIVGSQICSICNAEYEDCPHLIGVPYMGRFCRCILKNIVPDHVAIVEDPANRHCRVTHFGVPGGRRNKMTWKIEPKPIESNIVPDGALTVGAIILTAQDIGEAAISQNPEA